MGKKEELQGRTISGSRRLSDLTSGILQGSPLSGNLSLMAMDCLLEKLDRELSPIGCLLRACADDVGVVARALWHLARLEADFWDIESAAGLALHPGQEVVVPGAEGGVQSVLRRVRRQLALVWLSRRAVGAFSWLQAWARRWE